MNETKLSGRLTKDPVVRYTSSGKVVTQFIWLLTVSVRMIRMRLILFL